MTCSIISTEVITVRKYARFIGKDGSCGLEHGRVYKIDIRDNKSFFDPEPTFRYHVFPDNRIGIPYDTMTAIKKNWKFIE